LRFFEGSWCRLVSFFVLPLSNLSINNTHTHFRKKKKKTEEEEDERIFGREKIKTLSFRLSPSSSFVFVSLGYIVVVEREIERELLEHILDLNYDDCFFFFFFFFFFFNDDDGGVEKKCTTARRRRKRKRRTKRRSHEEYYE